MKWTSNEEEILIKKYPSNIGLEEISNILNKTARSIKHKASRLGLSKGKSPSNKPKNKYHRIKTEKEYYVKNKSKIYKNKVSRLRDKKNYLINYLGGKCSKCNYNSCIAALEFHHIKDNKEGNIANIIKNGSKEKALKEAKKCILLCANCHRELHYNGDIV